jgi:hypothetical protein
MSAASRRPKSIKTTKRSRWRKGFGFILDLIACLLIRFFVNTYRKQLAEIGALTEIAFGREKLFIHPKLMNLLTQEGSEFALYPAGSAV